MSKHKVGTRLVCHIEGVVTREEDSYAWLQPDNGSPMWTVDDDDTDWVQVPQPVDLPITSPLMAKAQENYERITTLLGVGSPQPKRTERELQLEAALIDAICLAKELVEYVPGYFRSKWDYDQSVAVLSVELDQLQAMP